MKFCELKKVNCEITQEELEAVTFSNKIKVNGLKDCSEKFCEYRGKDGCLLTK